MSALLQYLILLYCAVAIATVGADNNGQNDAQAAQARAAEAALAAHRAQQAKGSASSDVVDLTSKNWNEMINGSQSWIIMVYAPWCGHCKKMMPVLDALAKSIRHQRVRVAKLDATNEAAFASWLKIEVYPTMFILAEGESYRYAGAHTAEDLSRFALEGYRTAEPEPMWRNPLSLAGSALCRLIQVPSRLHGVYHYLHHDRGVSHAVMVTVLLFGSVALIVLLVFLLDVVFVRKNVGGIKWD
eukprot:jgi/Mesvir1/2797/Mv18690-RA.1